MPRRQIWQRTSVGFYCPRQLSFGAILLALILLTPGMAETKSQAIRSAPNNETVAGLEKESWALLKEGAASKSLRKRSDAIAALSSMSADPEAVKLIEAALDDKAPEVRRLAASSLGSMGEKGAIPMLRRAMDDKNPTVSFAAAVALWKLGDNSGAGIFYAVVLRERPVSKSFVASNISQAWSELHDPMALTMIGVSEASGAFLGPFAEGITIARELAKDGSAPARAYSATLLGQRPSANSRQILEDALEDKNVAVRTAATRALGGFHDPALIQRLAPLLSAKGTPVIKPVDSVRFMAAASILRLTKNTETDASR